MGKAIFMSLLAATIAIPIFVAKRARGARTGVRDVQRAFLVFSILYVAAVLYVVPRL